MASSWARTYRALARLVASRRPLVFLRTFEEDRALRLVRQVAANVFKTEATVFEWSSTLGLRQGDTPAREGSQDPLAGLDAVVGVDAPAIFAFCDLHPHFDDPRVVRRLREACGSLRDDNRTIVAISPTGKVPFELLREAFVLDLPLPGIEELSEIFVKVRGAFPRVQINLMEDEQAALLRAVGGMTEEEARGAFVRLFLGKKELAPTAIEEVLVEKRQMVGKEGVLEFVAHRPAVEEIGGLSKLKEWLRIRARFVSGESGVRGLQPPRGVLLMGVSGCGKSLAAKAIADLWQVALLRLDLARVYAGPLGTPEENLESALTMAETLAPCVLWIDEIETAILGGGSSDNMVHRLFSSFLTWMQEKKELVFVAATANQIDSLPPELLRKGRFDEIFYIGLPGEEQRAEVFSLHLARRGCDPLVFDTLSLAQSSSGFSAAEIEGAIVSAIYEASDRGEELTERIIHRQVANTVPLSTTMSEQIKTIERWAQARAVKAD